MQVVLQVEDRLKETTHQHSGHHLTRGDKLKLERAVDGMPSPIPTLKFLTPTQLSQVSIPGA